MRVLVMALGLLVFNVAHAGGICSAKRFGYETFCATYMDKFTCDAQENCRWANAGYGKCSAKQFGYESFCEMQPNEFVCEHQTYCFWVDAR